MQVILDFWGGEKLHFFLIFSSSVTWRSSLQFGAIRPNLSLLSDLFPWKAFVFIPSLLIKQ